MTALNIMPRAYSDDDLDRQVAIAHAHIRRQDEALADYDLVTADRFRPGDQIVTVDQRAIEITAVTVDGNRVNLAHEHGVLAVWRSTTCRRRTPPRTITTRPDQPTPRTVEPKLTSQARNHGQAINVDCPWCDAVAGNWCMTRSDWPAHAPHEARRALARKSLGTVVTLRDSNGPRKAAEERDAQTLAVTCPRCAAGPGESCVNDAGERAVVSHGARIASGRNQQ